MVIKSWNIKGMSCGHCVNTVEALLKEIGVKATANLNSHKLTAEFDEEKISDNKIATVLKDEGYEITEKN